jgi:hypothetical protein
MHPALRRKIASASSIAARSTVFLAPLKSDLLLDRGAGVATFTRATMSGTGAVANLGGYVADHERILRPVALNSAPFEGARVVTNWLLNSAAPATQNVTLPVGVYTLWATGAGSITSSAGTATITGGGAATGGSDNVFTVTAAGTVTFTYAATLTHIQLENGSAKHSEVITTTTVPVTKSYSTTLAGVPIPDSTLKGYLSEPSAVNLCLQSKAFDDVSWTKADSTIDATKVTAPDGTLTAQLLRDTATTAFHGITRQISFVSGTTYSQSIFAKPAGNNFLQIAFPGGQFSNCYSNFDLVNGVVSASNGTINTITPNANGFYKCTATATATGSAVVSMAFASQILGNASRFATYLGDITKGLYVWGAQLEATAYATSYIPTTTAAVTRAATALSYPTSGNYVNSLGSAYAEFIPKVAAAGGLIEATVLSTGATLTLTSSDGTATATTTATGTANTLAKGAASWSGTTAGIRNTLNGAAVTTANFDGTMVPTDTITIGGTAPRNIRNVRIYNRALTDAQLQSLTR